MQWECFSKYGRKGAKLDACAEPCVLILNQRTPNPGWHVDCSLSRGLSFRTQNFGRREKMIAYGRCNIVTLGGVVLLILGSTGCLATRKYVQTQAVTPLQGNIQTVDKKVDTKTGELDQRISEVDRNSERGYSEATAKAD